LHVTGTLILALTGGAARNIFDRVVGTNFRCRWSTTGASAGLILVKTRPNYALNLMKIEPDGVL
jgi:hypothetical protein